MRVKRTYEEVERSMVVYHIFVSVPRTFGGYCRPKAIVEIVQSISLLSNCVKANQIA